MPGKRTHNENEQTSPDKRLRTDYPISHYKTIKDLLCLAVINGNISQISNVINMHKESLCFKYSQHTPSAINFALGKAICIGKSDIICLILENGGSALDVDSSGEYWILELANNKINYDDLKVGTKILEILVEKAYNINEITLSQLEVLLSYAIGAGLTRMVEKILANRKLYLEFNLQDMIDLLEESSTTNQLKIFEIIITEVFRRFEPSKLDKEEILHFASKIGSINVIKMLKEDIFVGVIKDIISLQNINSPEILNKFFNTTFYTTIITAAEQEHFNIISFLSNEIANTGTRIQLLFNLLVKLSSTANKYEPTIKAIDTITLYLSSMYYFNEKGEKCIVRLTLEQEGHIFYTILKLKSHNSHKIIANLINRGMDINAVAIQRTGKSSLQLCLECYFDEQTAILLIKSQWEQFKIDYCNTGRLANYICTLIKKNKINLIEFLLGTYSKYMGPANKHVEKEILNAMFINNKNPVYLNIRDLIIMLVLDPTTSKEKCMDADKVNDVQMLKKIILRLAEEIGEKVNCENIKLCDITSDITFNESKIFPIRDQLNKIKAFANKIHDGNISEITYNTIYYLLYIKHLYTSHLLADRILKVDSLRRINRTDSKCPLWETLPEGIFNQITLFVEGKDPSIGSSTVENQYTKNLPIYCTLDNLHQQVCNAVHTKYIRYYADWHTPAYFRRSKPLDRINNTREIPKDVEMSV